MSPREFLGELEEMVLLAALRLKDEAYGASILRELDEEAGREVPRGSVYVSLDRLQAKGLIESRAGASTGHRRGRVRRMVTVTDKGLELLRRTHRVRRRLLDGLDEVIES